MTTASQYLDGLAATWTPPQGHFEAHRRHRAGIENSLDNHCGIHRMFETGSLRHGTGLYHYSDADYFASMKGARPTSATALLRVKNALQATYRSTSIVTRTPAVKCLFAGGDETVEVVPAYFATGGGYWIPDPNGDWMKSYPSDHNDYVNEHNRDPAGAAKRLARLAKLWKYRRQVPISSFYLEMRAAQYMAKEEYWVSYWDMYRFLNWLDDIGLADMNDPTGLGSRISPCSSTYNHTVALSKLSTAVGRAARAQQAASDGRDAAAIADLKMLFDT